jgi:hypothetical protein
MRKFIAITLLVLASFGSGAGAAEAPIRPHQAHIRVVAQAAGPAQWCYCG